MKATLSLFRKSEQRGKRMDYTSDFHVMEQSPINAFFTGKIDKLLDNNLCSFAEFPDYIPGLVRHLAKPCNLTVVVTRFVEQQAKRDVWGKAKYR